MRSIGRLGGKERRVSMKMMFAPVSELRRRLSELSRRLRLQIRQIRQIRHRDTEHLQSQDFNDIVTVSDYEGGDFRNGSV